MKWYMTHDEAASLDYEAIGITVAVDISMEEV